MNVEIEEAAPDTQRGIAAIPDFELEPLILVEVDLPRDSFLRLGEALAVLMAIGLNALLCYSSLRQSLPVAKLAEGASMSAPANMALPEPSAEVTSAVSSAVSPVDPIPSVTPDRKSAKSMPRPVIPDAVVKASKAPPRTPPSLIGNDSPLERNMWGADIGESFGAGGLGLSNIGSPRYRPRATEESVENKSRGRGSDGKPSKESPQSRKRIDPGE